MGENLKKKSSFFKMYVSSYSYLLNDQFMSSYIYEI